MNSPAATAIRHSAEQKAEALPALLVEAERVANTVAFGIHGRRRVGQGEAFWQFRQYAEGDPRSAIDWRKSARSAAHESLYVRESEWEAAQSVYFAVDTGPSMDFTSSRNHYSKKDAAEVLALATALLLVRAGERIASLKSSSPPASGRAAYNRFAEELLTKSQPNTLSIARRKLPAHARVIVISDFLRPLEDIQSDLDRIIDLGLSGYLLQINDASEEDFPFEGRTNFEAPTGNRHITFGRAENIREDYRRVFAAHRDALSNYASRADWGFGHHRTDTPPEAALLALYLHLSGDQIPRGQFGVA